MKIDPVNAQDTETRHASLLAKFIAFTMAMAIVGLLVTGKVMKDRIDEVRIAQSEVSHWTISRIEMDLAGLGLALRDAIETVGANRSDTTLDKLYDAFDIFYSRVRLVEMTISNLENPPDHLIEQARKLVEFRDSLTPRFDEKDLDSLKELRTLKATIDEGKELAASIASGSIVYFADTAARNRETEHQVWVGFGRVVALQLLAMALGVLLSVMLWRTLDRRIRASAELANMLSKIQDSALDSILLIDALGHIRQANPSSERVLGMKQEALVGQPISRFFAHRDERPESSFRLHEFFRDYQEGYTKTTCNRANQQQFPAEVACKFETDKNGEKIAIVFVRDITRQERIEHDLQLAIAEAQRHAAAKERFIAVMGHEMRTPLQGIIAAMELLKHGKADENVDKLIDLAVSNCWTALAQINDVLEMTKSDHCRESEDGFSPCCVVQEIAHTLFPLAKAKNNQLEVEFSNLDEHDEIVSLPMSFRRAMHNLIANAVKFTSDGEIHVSLRKKTSAEGAYLEVIVSDNGIGIAKEDQVRIFEPFEVAENAIRDTMNSAGLGLSIVLAAVEAMKGELTLESEPGLGSVFTLRIPFKPIFRASNGHALLGSGGCTVADDPQVSAPSLANLKVLIIDDNEMNLKLMARMVDLLGCETRTANSAVFGLAIIERETPDVLLIDLNMPDINGFEAASRIRERIDARRMPIVAITAHVDSSVESKAKLSGIQIVLPKPFDMAQLANTLISIGDKGLEFQQSLLGQPVSEDAKKTFYSSLEQFVSFLGKEEALALVRTALNEDVPKAVAELMNKSASHHEVEALVHRAVGSCGFAGMSGLHSILIEIEQNRYEEAEITDLTSQISLWLDEYERWVVEFQNTSA